MKGFLALEPDAATLAGLVARQNRLRNGLTRQGVFFPERLHASLVAWPFARPDELEEACRLVAPHVSSFVLSSVRGLPNEDRPAEIGQVLADAESLQREIWEGLRLLLDPDPVKEPHVRLARVAPPSRKVGIALRASGLLGTGADRFVPESLGIWRQTPQGFEIYRRMRFGHGAT